MKFTRMLLLFLATVLLCASTIQIADASDKMSFADNTINFWKNVGVNEYKWKLYPFNDQFVIRSSNDGTQTSSQIEINHSGKVDFPYHIWVSGNIGIGESDPQHQLDIHGPGSVIRCKGYDGYTASLQLYEGWADSYGFEFKYDGQVDKLYLWSRGFLDNEAIRMTFLKDGKIGIGTENPAGKLDVNGTIYQRGSSLHADYIFEDKNSIVPISEHAKKMWEQKHLPAVPGKRVDENGLEVLEVGAHRKGMLEELELAHIYIDQLNNRIQKIEELNAKLIQEIEQLKEVKQ